MLCAGIQLKWLNCLLDIVRQKGYHLPCNESFSIEAYYGFIDCRMRVRLGTKFIPGNWDARIKWQECGLKLKCTYVNVCPLS